MAAYDSTGKTLQARLVLEAEQVLIRVGDTEAKYPLVIDPFIEVAQITSSEATPDSEFGASVAISGNTLVIGTPQLGITAHGAAYVFVEPGTGWATTSTFVARLTASRRCLGGSVWHFRSHQGAEVHPGMLSRGDLSGCCAVL